MKNYVNTSLKIHSFAVLGCFMNFLHNSITHPVSQSLLTTSSGICIGKLLTFCNHELLFYENLNISKDYCDFFPLAESPLMIS